MSTIANEIIQGLEEAVAYAGGKADVSQYRVHTPEKIDVRALREKLHLTQREFAARYRFSIKTLQHWEQKKRTPEGPARTLLTMIDRAPETVLRILSESS